MSAWVDELSQTFTQMKNVVLVTVGVISLVVGAVLVPVPLVPGWPFLLFGAYCLQQVFQTGS